MNIENFYFDQPIWLWGMTIIPLTWIAFYLLSRSTSSLKHFENLIDSHLLPFLIIEKKTERNSTWKFKLALWSIIWGGITLALAGPRWDYRDIETTSKDQNLVILLDLSESMNATDIKPSRLIRARQKIEDLLHNSEGIKIGLIAFAADPHMITPLTDDKETIRHLLPSLSTELIHIQGSRLSPALKMASRMLTSEPGHQQAVVIISDGGFEDHSAITLAKELAEKGLSIHTIGVGTLEGSILQDAQGNLIKRNGQPALSKLEREPLLEISKIGQGFYIEPRYSAYIEKDILDRLQSNSKTINNGKKMRLWDEGFLYFLLPALPLLLYWFRKGFYIVSVIWIVIVPFSSLQAGITQKYFLNSEENGAEAFENGDYEKAAQTFKDPYRKGVALYKAGKFAEAENMFKESQREEVAQDASYNLGNSLAQQHKFQEAITAYKEVLKKWPEHIPSKENLAIVEDLLKQQEQNKESQRENQEKNSQQNSNKDNSSKEQQNQAEPSKENSAEQSSEDSSSENDPINESESNEEKPTPTPNHDPAEISDKQSEDNQAEQNSEKDQDANIWLNRLTSDPKTFLKNKFLVETQKNGTREGIDPW